MSRATVAGRFMLVAETVDETSRVVRAVLRDEAGAVRAFGSPKEAIDAWLDSIEDDGARAIEFAKQGASRFFDVRRGSASQLFHVRAARLKD